jgi:hypothetical protein
MLISSWKGKTDAPALNPSLAKKICSAQKLENIRTLNAGDEELMMFLNLFLLIMQLNFDFILNLDPCSQRSVSLIVNRRLPQEGEELIYAPYLRNHDEKLHTGFQNIMIQVSYFGENGSQFYLHRKIYCSRQIDHQTGYGYVYHRYTGPVYCCRLC